MGKNSSIFIHSVSAPKPHETDGGSDAGGGMSRKRMKGMHRKGDCYVEQGEINYSSGTHSSAAFFHLHPHARTTEAILPIPLRNHD